MRVKLLHSLAIAVSVIALLATPSHAINITSGDVVANNLGSYGFTASNSVLSYDGGVTDELYQMYGYIGNSNGVVADRSVGHGCAVRTS